MCDVLQAKGKKPLFVQLVLDNIWSLYDAVVIRRLVTFYYFSKMSFPKKHEEAATFTDCSQLSGRFHTEAVMFSGQVGTPSRPRGRNGRTFSLFKSSETRRRWRRW